MELIKIKDNNLEVSFKVKIPDTKIIENIKTKISELNQSVKLNGFRKGKIPEQILKQKYGSSIRAEVIQHTVDDALNKLIKEKNLHLFTSPKVVEMQNHEGKDLEFNVELILKPDIKIIDWEKINLVKPNIKISNDDIRKEILLMLEKYENIYEESSFKSSRGDFIIIDMDVFIGEDKIEKASFKNKKIEIGAGIFLPELEESIIGLQTGNNKNIEIEIPDSHNNKFAKNVLKCNIHVVKLLKAKKNLKIDDSIAQKVGFQDLQELKQSITNSIQEYYENLKNNFLKITLFDVLENLLEFSVPESLLNNEIQNIKEKYENYKSKALQEENLLKNHFSYMNNLEFMKITNKETEEEREEYLKKVATRRLKIGIFIEDFVLQNKINVSQEEIIELVTQQASFFPDRAEEIVNFYQTNPKLLEALIRPKLEDKAVKKILEKVNLEEKIFSRDALEKSLKTFHKL